MRSQLNEKERRVLEATLELMNNSDFYDASMSKIAKLGNVHRLSYIYILRIKKN